jgi:formate hydrogenlyase subunit 3/multisubunit Na+/H+ antiporter MnhD subunit
MSDAFSSAALPLVLVWPLLLAMGVAFVSTRPLALMFAPWAALPALVAAVAFDDTSLGLPAAMLGSELVIDATGRVFLALSAALWLASGWLARPRLCAAESSHFAVLLLLAMTGGLGMAMAGDALLFFTTSTLAGYALYGLLVCETDLAARQAGRVLVVLLVVSDLLVFELLLILSQAAGSVDFMVLRQAFASTEKQALLLALLVAGFGIKLGVGGLHFWLSPVFTAVVPALRPALISFMLGGGLLGWLRLAPLGGVHWFAAGGAMLWLAWITLGYAMIVGVLQSQVRSMLAYVAVALSALWVALLGAALVDPQVWKAVAEATMPAMLQSGFALTVLLLLSGRAADDDTAASRRLGLGLKWLAVWLLAAVPVGVAAALGEFHCMTVWQLRGVTVVTAFLAARGLLLQGAVSRNAHELSPPMTAAQQPTQVSTGTTLLVAAGLTLAALLAAAFSLVGQSFSEFWINTLMMSIAALVAWLSFGRFALPLPTRPPDDLLVPISNGLSMAFDRGRRLGGRQLPLWRDAGLARVRRFRPDADWRRMLERVEFALNRWPTVLLTLLLLGLTLAWWSGVG